MGTPSTNKWKVKRNMHKSVHKITAIDEGDAQAI